MNYDTLYILGKIRMRELHREQEALRLAREAQDFHPGRIRATLNQVVSLFKLLAFKLEKRFAFGHTLREKVVAVRHQTSSTVKGSHARLSDSRCE